MSFNLYDPLFLAGVLREVPDKPHFLRDTFFNKPITFATEYVLFDVVKGGRKMTPFVHPAAAAPQSERLGYHTESYRPAAVKEQRAVDVFQLQTRLAGEVVMNSNVTPAERAATLLAQDVQDLKDNLQRREEWMAAQVLFTGKIEVKGEGVNDVIDFGFANQESLGGTKKWNAAEADIFGDLLAWQSKVQKESGYRPNTLLASSATIDMILRNEAVLKLTDNRRMDYGDNRTRNLGQGAAYRGRLAGMVNLDLYSYDNYYDDPVTGETKAFVPDNTICLCSPEAEFVRMYGAVPYLQRVSGDDMGHFVMSEGEYLIDSYSTKNPDAQFVKLESRPLFVPKQVDSYLIATIA